MNHIKLNTGDKMPIIGLGTWKSEPGKVGAAVEYAVEQAGYRHVDCARAYHNEAEVGEALQKIFAAGKINRNDIFITSKLWNTAHARADVATACRETLRDLKLDYLDLYLMHWGMATIYDTNHIGTMHDNPHNELYDEAGYIATAKIPIRETWEAMQDLVRQGLVKAIGVANFTGPMLIDLLSYAEIPPAMNQIEMHAYLQQTKLVEFCHHKKIALTAYSPLGTPGNAKARGDRTILLEDPTLTTIAEHHHKSPAQVLIRWAIERGTVVIPKSVTPANIEGNFQIFDFSLTAEDLRLMAELDRGYRFVDPSEWWKIPYFN